MNNQVSDEAESQDICNNPLVIIVSGPSGVGKDAILNRMKQGNYPFEFVVTLTTRKPRNNEKHNVDYHFVSLEEYQHLLENDGLLESASVYGNWYGVPKQPIRDALKRGRDTIIKVDVQGAASIKKVIPEAVFIFIMPPSLEELNRRLTRRSIETPAELSLRLNTARHEMEQVSTFDYAVYNPDRNIDSAIEDIMAIVRAEKCRAVPRKIKI